MRLTGFVGRDTPAGPVTRAHKECANKAWSVQGSPD